MTIMIDRMVVIQLAIVLVFHPTPSTRQSGWLSGDDFFARHQAIAHNLEHRHSLTLGDGIYLAREVKHDSPGRAIASASLLAEAVYYEAFPKASAEEAYEARSTTAKHGEGSVLAGLYWQISVGTLPPQKEFDHIRRLRKPESNIGRDETAFISRDLKHGGAYAGCLLVSKSHMLLGARTWAM